MSTFPIYRPRRLRANENLRRLVRETTLSVNDLIYPDVRRSRKRYRDRNLSNAGLLSILS